MKYLNLSFACSAFALAVAAPASAQVVYQSVADLSDGNQNAVYCSECSYLQTQVSDQFTLSAGSDITGVKLWLYAGGGYDAVSTVGYTFDVWDSTKTNLIFSQKIFPLTVFADQAGIYGRQQILGGSVSGLSLTAGTYWAGFHLDWDPQVAENMAILGFVGGNGTYTGMNVFNGQVASGNPGYQLLGPERANNPPAVPEAQSWAMMVAGFGLVGAAIRRRKLAVSFA